MQPTAQVTTASQHFSRINPVHWLCRLIEKVVACILRTSLFQVGENNKFWARQCMRLYQVMSGCKGGQVSIDPERVARSQEFLQRIGGEAFTVDAADGAKIHSMRFTSNAFFEHLTQMDGYRALFISEDGIRYIQANSGSDCDQFLQEFKCGFSRTEEGAFCYFQLPPRVAISSAVDTPLILECLSPRSFEMNRAYTAQVLASGCDYITFNYRGTIHSTGAPSEAGYYADAEAVYQHAKGYFIYEAKNIWLSGFCLGFAVAAHLFARHSREDVHLIGKNPFSTFSGVVECHGKGAQWFVSRFGGISALQLHDTTYPDQNGFDVVRTLQNIEHPPGGTVTLICTEGDTRVPASSIEDLIGALPDRISGELIINPCPETDDPHATPPTKNPATWAALIKRISTVYSERANPARTAA